MEQEADHLRRTDTSNQRNVALNNLPDKFRNIDTTRKTCLEEPEEEGTILDEEEWVEEYKRLEALREGGDVSSEEDTEYVETVEECKVEFKYFLNNIGNKDKDVH